MRTVTSFWTGAIWLDERCVNAILVIYSRLAFAYREFNDK